MKKLTFLFLLVFCVVLLWAANSSNTQRESIVNLKNEIRNNIKDKQFKSKTLNMVIELEEPTEYQKNQIYNLFNNLCANAKKSNITDIGGLIAFINSQIPGDPEDTKDYTLFKYAFPESKGQAPKGSFDCDSRSLLVLSVLEALGKSQNIKLVDLTGHVILTDIKTKKYFDLTLKDINVVPDQDKLLLSNILFKNDDLKSLLLTNIATDYASKGAGNVVLNKEGDKETLQKAQKLLEEAITLNPRNIAAINNAKYVLSVMPQEKVYDEEGYRDYTAGYDEMKQKEAIYNVLTLSVLIQNYTDNNQAPIPNLFVCKETPYCPETPAQEQAVSDFAKAFKGSSYIANYTLNQVLQKLFYANLYSEFLRLGNGLLKENALDSIPGIWQFYKQMAISAALTFDFDSFKQFYNKVKNKDKELEYLYDAVDIVLGTKSAEQVAQDYKNRESYPNDLYRYITDDRLNNDMFYAIDLLKAWNSFPQFKNEVKNLIK